MSIDKKLELLRKEMRDNAIAAIIVPSSDSHQSEYVADHWKSREWISGFTGSAGTAVITLDHAGLWTDSRYFLQAGEELSGSEFELHKVLNYSPDFIEFLLENLDEGSKVACDARVFSKNEIENYKKMFSSKNIEVLVHLDLIGDIWSDRPLLPQGHVLDHDLSYAGRSVTQKLSAIREEMYKKGADEYLVTALDNIAWTFNLRGNDIEFNPVFYAFAVIRKESVSLFIDPLKVPGELSAKLAEAGVKIEAYDLVYKYVQSLSESVKLFLTASGVNYRLFDLVNASIIDGEDIIADLKAIKNEVEIGHFRRVMEKDAVALTKLYMWLDECLKERNVSEFELAEKLAEFRSLQGGYFGESFAAIAGYASNGAIVHYRPMPDNCAMIKAEGILLLDSGGQYMDGTTDITRTTALGPVSEEAKKHFTLVLKGHIAIDQLEFPEGINGYQLDAFARQFLWKHGINYFHGTGHGVGFFLNVHEGPHGISFVLSDRSKKPMLPGMVTSNEPGFYVEGEYGIRIENLVLTRFSQETAFGKFLGQETLTLFPIDKALIDTKLLTKDELIWLNDYHKVVYKRVSPLLNDEEKSWLEDKCAAII